MAEHTGRTARGEMTLGSSSFRSRSRSTGTSLPSAAATLARSSAPALAGGSDARGRRALTGTTADAEQAVAAAHRRGGYGVAALFRLAGDCAPEPDLGGDTGTTVGRPRFRARHGLLCRWHSTRFAATTPSAAACATGDAAAAAVASVGLGAMGRNRARISLALTAVSAGCTMAMARRAAGAGGLTS